MSDENVYEQESYLDMYMLFHFGSKKETMPWEFGPTNGLEFPLRCANLCLKHWKKLGNSTSKSSTRALDIGCAVGRSTFELSRSFDEVVGVDYSQSFVDAARTLTETGKLHYKSLTQGELQDCLLGEVDNAIDRTKCRFEKGDACNLRPDLGKFDCVLAANLICRLEKPRDFLERMKEMILPGGLLVITSPYTFKTEFTKRENLIGGIVKEDGDRYTAIEGLKDILGSHFTLIEATDMPFSIKETARKFQWTVSHATVWKRL